MLLVGQASCLSSCPRTRASRLDPGSKSGVTNGRQDACPTLSSPGLYLFDGALVIVLHFQKVRCQLHGSAGLRAGGFGVTGTEAGATGTRFRTHATSTSEYETEFEYESA